MFRSAFLRCSKGGPSFLRNPEHSAWVHQVNEVADPKVDLGNTKRHFSYIRAAREGALGCIKIDRPKALNAMDAGVNLSYEQNIQNTWPSRCFGSFCAQIFQEQLS